MTPTYTKMPLYFKIIFTVLAHFAFCRPTANFDRLGPVKNRDRLASKSHSSI